MSHKASRPTPSLTNPLLQSRVSKATTSLLLSHSSAAGSKLSSKEATSTDRTLGSSSLKTQASLTSQLSQEKAGSSSSTPLRNSPTLMQRSSLLTSGTSLLPHSTALSTSRPLTTSHIAKTEAKLGSTLLTGSFGKSSSLLGSSSSLTSKLTLSGGASTRPQLASSRLSASTKVSSNLCSSVLKTSLTSSASTSMSHAMGKPLGVVLAVKTDLKTTAEKTGPLRTAAEKTSLRTKSLLLTSSKPSGHTTSSLSTNTAVKTTVSKCSLYGGSLVTSKPAETGVSMPLCVSEQKAEDITDGISAVSKPITERTEGAPQYDFSAERAESPVEPKFLPPELDTSVQEPTPPLVDIVGMKTTLINSVATSLLCSPDFHSSRDPTRRSLYKLGEKLARYDPEFILKLALYTRRDLNIRTTANFLLALAANVPGCRPFLKKYYCSSIRLPSDWIEVAEIYQAFHDSSLNFGALPTALRKVMATKFLEFDAYQLGKYNKDSSKRKKKKQATEKGKTDEKKKGRKPTEKKPQTMAKQLFGKKPPVLHEISISSSESSDSIVRSDGETEEEIERLTFTLKQLIRKIHIAEPVEYVMCLVGKRYPDDSEAFRKSHLPGTWEQDRAGKRMKLPTPETWETQVSTKGNKAKTWEDLIDHEKLPFMAMLRNLRNLILAGVSQKHHQWAIRKLNNERAVVYSRQFPFRFFSAYEVLGQLEKMADGVAPPTRKGAKKSKKPPKELPPIDKKLLDRYRTALDNALKIATCYNVKPISGSTLILCNVGSNMDRPCTAARGLGKPRTVFEVGVLLGLMCKYSCEQCTMLIYGENDHAEVQLQEGTILHNMEHVMTTANREGLSSRNGVLPTGFLTNMLIDREPVDNIVVLTDTMKLDNQEGKVMMDFLKKYRHLVNPNLLFVSVDLSGRSSGLSSTITPEHPNDIFLAGYSDQILRFIAERGDSGQLTYVDNIDKAYNLKALTLPSLAPTKSGDLARPTLAPEKALLATSQNQRWRSVRVFISSTFRDMHGERDLLTRFVFPELRARAHSKRIQVYEVDLRWGVTEEDARSHKALEICLGEISRSQYFIGLLGQRYGWTQDEYHVPDAPEFDWLRDFPPGRSITEIEMYHAALCDTDKAVGKAFFYFRDTSFIPSIPEDFRDDFESESHEALQKIERLKSDILTSGLEVYNGYPAQWLGQVEGKSLAGDLEEFGQRVLHNLWNAIQKDFPDDELVQDPVAYAKSLHEAFMESRASTFVGRRTLLKQAQDLVEDGSGKLVIVAGKPGSGKSAFMAAFAQQFSASEMCTSSDMLLSHFLGAAPDSTNIASLLSRLCCEMKQRFGLTLEVPEDYTDIAKDWPDFLAQSVSNAGAGKKLVVLIDGIDLLEDLHNGRSMDWIPDKIPDGVVVVLSGVENGSCVSNLRKRHPSPEEILIGAMDIFDKAEMVRRRLSKNRKKLDESPFNNQMKLLLTKKDAANPLYLHLACEELRVFGIYEKVNAFLKKMPPTVSNLLQDVLLRLEMEHTSDVLSAALLFLSIVRNGLLEHELSGALSLTFNQKESDNGAVLSPMVMSRLLRSLQSFLQPTRQENANLLSLAHKDIEKAVHSRYIKGASASKEKDFHQLLAGYFRTEADPSGDGTYKGNNARAFSELPYHLMAAGAWKQLEEVVCNFHFVVAKCQLGLAQQLLEDYMPSSGSLPPAKTKELAKFIHLPKVNEYKSFVSRNLHVLSSNPTLALQQAVNEPNTSQVAKIAADILHGQPHPLISWVNKPNQVNPCKMKISSHTGSITCVSISPESTHFAVGFKNCAVKLFEVATGKEIHTFIGHASGITSTCFVGSHALCSASRDNTLSLWDIKEGIRIAVMKGHSRPVHGCSADQSGKSIASVSWDTSIKVWDGRSGKIVSTLQTKGQHNTPINCVSFHPEGQVIVVGSWDKTLKIWDTFNQKRLKVLKGHKSSVQACTYAPSGRHIVSAALDGEVKIWSMKSGSAIGTIVGHHSPVSGVSFTPNGQYLVTASSDKLLKVWSGSLGQHTLSMGSGDYGFAHCLFFSPETQTIRVGYHDGHVRKFNIQTGMEIFAVKPHSAEIVGLAYHSNLHMSASADGTIKVWTPSILPKCIDLVGHKAPLTCAVWDKHGFASASEDLSILVWTHKPRDYTKMMVGLKVKGKAPKDFTAGPIGTLHGHTAKITSIAFSNNGLKMVTASRDLSLIVWDTFNHKPIQTLHACHKDWINTCTFSNTSSDFLVTGSNDFTLKVWDLNSGTAKSTFKGHTSSINSVAFSQGCIVSAAFDGSVKVWTHKGVEITTMYCHKQRVNACLVNIPNNSSSSSSISDWADIVSDEEELKQKVQLDLIKVITASDDGTVGVWKPFVPHEVTTLVGHSDRVLSVGTTLNNDIISCSLDESVRLWSPGLSSELSFKTSLKGHTGPVTAASSVLVGSDLSYFATAGRDGSFIVWEIKMAEEVQFEKLYEVRDSDKAISSLCISVLPKNSGRFKLVVGKDDGSMNMYQFTPSEYPTRDLTIVAGTLMGPHPVSKLMLTPDSKQIIAGSWSNRIAAIGDNMKVSSRMEMHKDWVMDVVVTEANQKSFVYSIGLDSVLYCWEPPGKQGPSRQPYSIASNAVRYPINLDPPGEKQPGWLLALCEVPETPYLVISDSKGRVTLWNKNKKKIEATKKVHQKTINALAAIRDGCFVTGSDDGTVKVWRINKQRCNLKQLGQFYCQSCVTTITVVGRKDKKNEHPLFVVGDSLGHVTLLQWHQ